MPLPSSWQAERGWSGGLEQGWGRWGGGGAVPLEAGPGARPTTVISGLRLKAHNKRHLLPPK